MSEPSTPPIPTSPTSPAVIVRIVLALGLSLLLLVGAWTDSHGEDAAGVGICVAAGVSADGDTDQLTSAAADASSSPAGLLGICTVVVFLLVLLALRLVRPLSELRLGRAATASATPRAGPAAPTARPTLAELCIFRV